MPTEVKLIMQSNVTVNKNDGSFNLNLAAAPGRWKKLLLSNNDYFMINSFRVNGNTKDINHILCFNKGGIEINVSQSEVKYVLQNVRSTKKMLGDEQKNWSTLKFTSIPMTIQNWKR